MQALRALWDALPCLLDMHERALPESEIPKAAIYPPADGMPFSRDYLEIVVGEATAALRHADYPLDNAAGYTLACPGEMSGPAADLLTADAFLRYMQLPQGDPREQFGAAAEGLPTEQLIEAGPDVLRCG